MVASYLRQAQKIDQVDLVLVKHSTSSSLLLVVVLLPIKR